MRDIGKVMLVDDDADLRSLAALTLERLAGWTVVAVESGERALELIASAQPDLILLDATMPTLDGLATLQLLRERGFCEVPVIFFTAKVQAREIERYLEAGACGVVEKPFDPMSLPDRIEKILARSHP